VIKYRHILIVLAAGIIIALGFIRDSLFKHINYNIYQLENSTGKIIGSKFYQKVFENISLTELHYSKWILTLVFVLIYYTLTTIGIRLVFKTKKYKLLIFSIFSVIFVISGTCYIIGDLTNNLAHGYRFSRLFMGAMQSPFILLLLIPGIKFFEKNRDSVEH
jgi:hypothetical protein